MSDQIFDLAVIGSGISGMAASLFGARAGLKVIRFGSTGGIDFSSGWLDLLGVYPSEAGRIRTDPFKAIAELKQKRTGHPYDNLNPALILEAFNGFVAFLKESGLSYAGHETLNTRVITPMGTVRSTFRLPRTCIAGADALQNQNQAVIIDIKGLKGFSSRQIVQTLSDEWPCLKAAGISWPETRGEVMPEQLAWSLAVPKNREIMAGLLLEKCRTETHIGLPAILGIHNPGQVIDHLEELTGKIIFEIPTMPPSIAGMRLRTALDQGLSDLGVQIMAQKLVKSCQITSNGFEITMPDLPAAQTFMAKKLILASGHLLGTGLKADRKRIFEPLLNLHVCQPESRSEWHAPTFFDLNGHPVNRAGLATDSQLHPLDEKGRVVSKNLFAVGALLAHNDWMRLKCGAGVSISTALHAVNNLT